MSHSHEAQSYNRSFAIAVFANSIFVVLEAMYALSSSSMSLLADAGHNLGDVLGLLFAWFANWLLTREPAPHFSYGHKKATILAALFNAILLILTAGFIAVEALNKVMHPEDVQEVTVIVVAFVGILLNGATAMLFFKGRKNDINIKGAFLHLAYDALISLVVVIAGIAIYFTQKDIIDPILSLFIVVMILYGSWDLLKDSMRLILDAVPREINLNAVKDYLNQIPGVTHAHDVHIWGLSTREIALTAHLVMPNGTLSDEDYNVINKELWRNFKINHVTLQVERGTLINPCDQATGC